MAATTQAPLQRPVPSGNLAGVDPRWLQPHYVVKERKFTLSRQYRVLTPDGQLVAFCKQKMFKLKEDIRFYADESQKVELFRLQAQKVIDFNANLAVIDSQSGAAVGYLRRKGWKAIFKDEWLVFDAHGIQVGNLHEDSGGMAFLRRFIASIIPYHYHFLVGPQGAQRQAADIQERFQLFGDTYDLRRDPAAPVDARILIGLTVCIDAMEGQ